LASDVFAAAEKPKASLIFLVFMLSVPVPNPHHQPPINLTDTVFPLLLCSSKMHLLLSRSQPVREAGLLFRGEDSEAGERREWELTLLPRVQELPLTILLGHSNPTCSNSTGSHGLASRFQPGHL
jgi:hypothetical protein